MDLFQGLNPQQKKAVELVKGRLLVLAGAGSGKTRVLTLRMAHLVKNLGVSPKALLGLTFTNKAAAEMRHRLGSLIDASSVKQVTLCTFHSFCMQILRCEIQRLGYTAQFTLYDEKDMQRLINMISRDILEHEGQLPSLTPTVEAISLAKSKGLKPHEIAQTGSTWHDGFIRDLYQRLTNCMRAYNVVDFDSLLSLAVDLFEQHSDVLEKYQDRFQYIMIDEYQDTNPIQYHLAELLAKKHQNLCVVGDDDQSIYGWRGADVQNILDFSNASIVKLEQNYRSSNLILNAANAVISNNRKRHGKALWSSKGAGEPIEVFHAPTEIDEAQAVVCRLAKLREKHGLKWSDIAILYRSNALARAFELALMKHSWKEGETWHRGVPYEVFGGTEFYERREVKDLVAYLRVIVNPFDEEALLRVINHPRRGIGEAALDHITSYNRQNEKPLWNVLEDVANDKVCIAQLKGDISAKAQKGIREFIELIEAAKGRFLHVSLKDSLVWMIEKMNYRKAIDEEVKSMQMREFKWQNVQDFIATVSDYEQRIGQDAGNKPSLHDFVLSFPLEKNWNAGGKSGSGDKVTLMTFHSAKGLEFPACFLVGMEDHIIPHEKSLKETGLEEERRLMYVAITRAMKFLVISMARQRKRMGVEVASTPSRFLMEIPKECMKVTLWHQVD